MKNAKAKWWSLRSIVGLVTQNWGLKILALVLAVVMYYAMKPAGEGAAVPSERIKFEKVES